MNFADYVTQTDTTAVYPEAGTGSLRALSYVALGLVGESSEVLEKSLADDAAGVVAELGDTSWYLARFYRELGLDLADAAERASSSTDHLDHPAGRLIVAVGRVAEMVKKAIRDDGSALTAERRVSLEVSLTRVLVCWLGIHHAHGLPTGDTLAGNAAKLTSRRERGVLAGSGDDR